MTRGLRRTFIIFASAFLIVLSTYTFLEISSIDETVNEVIEVYEDQLSAILFSVNQYSQDVLNSWIVDFEPLLWSQSKDSANLTMDFFADHPAILMGFSADQNAESIRFSAPIKQDQAESIKAILTASASTIEKLIQYQQSGYQKLEPVQDKEGNNYLIFISNKEQEAKVMGMQIDPDVFISEILSPRLQTIAREEIILSALSAQNDSIVYSTNREFLDENELITTQGSSLWLFPSHYLGVSFMDRTLNDLVRERTRNNLIMLVLINIVLIVGFVVIIRSVDKQVKLAKMKSDFVSNVSHEIRTPLALISMYAETLEMGRVRNDEERTKFYHIILSETKRLTGLVNRILKFSKLEAGKQTYDFQRLSLNEIVDEVLTSFDFHLLEGGFTIDVEKANEIYIKADRDSISTVVFNLLDNAIKYSGDSKKIKLVTGNIDNQIYVKVIDEGLGIPQRDKDRIFEKFYRVEDPLIHNTKGSGLGLNLVFEIMKDHGGDVKVKSKVGKGSEFTLFFPKIDT